MHPVTRHHLARRSVPRRRALPGFTLIELIVTIVILGILAALAVPAFNAVMDRSRVQTEITYWESVAREANALAAFDQVPVSPAHVAEAVADGGGAAAAEAVLAAALPRYTFDDGDGVLDPGEYVAVIVGSAPSSELWVFAQPLDSDQLIVVHVAEVSVDATVAGVHVSSEDVAVSGGTVIPTLGSLGFFDATGDGVDEYVLDPDVNTEGPLDHIILNAPDDGSQGTTAAPTYPADAMVLVFDSTLAGASPAGTVSVALVTADATIDWGDGTVEPVSGNGPFSHAYATPGEHVVQITGTAYGYNSNVLGGGDQSRLTAVLQWGDLGLTSIANAFNGASNLVDVPADLGALQDMTSWAYSFSGTSSLDDRDIEQWDMSGVTVLAGMFQGSGLTTPDLTGWDTSAVTNLSWMFLNASDFNGDVSTWDTSSVTRMDRLFMSSSFDGDVSTWDTSSVTNMSYLFFASDFNGDVSTWDTSSVTNMSNLFRSSPFNGDVSTWQTGNVTRMDAMFASTAFNGDVSTWQTGSVTNMHTMFFANTVFNQDISQWDTSSVTDMTWMLRSAQVFDQDISQWDTSSVTSMNATFYGAYAFNQDLSSWVVTAVNDCDSFDGATLSWTLPKPAFTSCTP